MIAHDRQAWDLLADAAWPARANAHLHEPTAVGAGAAVLDSHGRVFAGCNVEHRFRSYCVHAEVNALMSMVVAGGGPAVRILIAGEREQFTPCRACMDWIFELGGPSCIVGFQAAPMAFVEPIRVDELMHR